MYMKSTNVSFINYILWSRQLWDYLIITENYIAIKAMMTTQSESDDDWLIFFVCANSMYKVNTIIHV